MTVYEKIKKFRFVWQGLQTWLPIKMRFGWQHMPQFTSSQVRKPADYRDMARAGYTVLLRQLSILGKPMSEVQQMAEVGPGDSLAVGIAALLAGANTYYPIDRLKRTLGYDNTKILNILVDMFKSREPIPDNNEFPKAYPLLKSYAFPEALLPNLESLLVKERIAAIAGVVAKVQGGSRLATASGPGGGYYH